MVCRGHPEACVMGKYNLCMRQFNMDKGFLQIYLSKKVSYLSGSRNSFIQHQTKPDVSKVCEVSG
jgi:hypothetical protein